MALNLKYQTKTEFATRFRAKFKNSSGLETARLAYILLNFISAGDFTDTQVRNAFELTVNQYTTLKDKMIALRDKWLDVLAARGE